MTFVSKLGVTAGLALALSTSAFAADEPAGRELARLGFLSIDANGDKIATVGEFMQYGEDVMASMDSNEDGAITYDEFSTWDFGFTNIAEAEGKMQGLDTARKIVFDFWDRSDDQVITGLEQQAAVVANIGYADLDGDGALSELEYLRGFIVNIAFRSALRDDM